MGVWPFSRSPRWPAPLADRAEEYIHTTLGDRDAIRAHGGAVRSAVEIAEGTNSETWRVTLERGDVIARFWKIETWRDRASEIAHVMPRLAALGIPVPRLIDQDLSDETTGRLGLRVTVEEFIPDRQLTEADLANDDVRRQLVSVLRLFHAESSAIAGHPWRRENDMHPWDRWTRQRIRKLCKRVRTQRPQHCAAVKSVRRALLAHRPPTAAVSPFNLVHGDVQPANFLLSDAGHLTVIDFGTVKHVPFEIDLVVGEACFGAHFAPVLAEYLAGVSPPTRERFERHADFFRVLNHLERACSGWRKATRPKYRAEHEHHRQRGDRSWQSLQEVIGQLA